MRLFYLHMDEVVYCNIRGRCPGGCMEGGILNEPVRESAEKLMSTFGEQLSIPFTNLVFVAVGEDGTFRSANYSKGLSLDAEAVRLIAKHLTHWADTMEE